MDGRSDPGPQAPSTERPLRPALAGRPAGSGEPPEDPSDHGTPGPGPRPRTAWTEGDPDGDGPEPDGWLSEYSTTLREIQEALERIPGRPRDAPGDPEEGDLGAGRHGTPSDATTEDARSGAPPRDIAGGFLDERLATARALASSVRGEVASLGRRVDELRAESERLDGELDAALRELAFIRQEPWALRRPGNGILADDPDGEEAELESLRRRNRLRPRPSAPYAGFTEARYRETMEALHGRRTRLWGAVVAASVAISAVLLLLTLRAPDPLPSPWVASLPLVWLVPVPFFASAFYGTHRLLAERTLLPPRVP